MFAKLKRIISFKSIVCLIWFVIGITLLTVGLIEGNLGTTNSTINYATKYINGDAYNYMIEASIKAGKMSLYAGSIVRKTLIVCCGLIIMFFSSMVMFMGVKKNKKVVINNSDENNTL